MFDNNKNPRMKNGFTRLSNSNNLWEIQIKNWGKFRIHSFIYKQIDVTKISYKRLLRVIKKVSHIFMRLGLLWLFWYEKLAIRPKHLKVPMDFLIPKYQIIVKDYCMGIRFPYIFVKVDDFHVHNFIIENFIK